MKNHNLLLSKFLDLVQDAEDDSFGAGRADGVVVGLDVHDELEPVGDAVPGVGNHCPGDSV